MNSKVRMQIISCDGFEFEIIENKIPWSHLALVFEFSQVLPLPQF
jgi:hypothetical protein